MKAIRNVYLLAGVAIIAAGVYVYMKGPGNVGQQVGGAAVDMVNGVVTGVVESIGEGFGVPKTNMTECQKAMNESRTWDASFACPAKDFIGYLWD